MKYIRTKDRRIIDTERITNSGIKLFHLVARDATLLDGWYWDLGSFGIDLEVADKDIIKQADTIEELIMPGDLVRYDVLYMSWIEKDRGDKVRGIDMHLIPRQSVDMLWIPTGNDTECYPNFKLVASKENEKGELELL